MLIGSAGAGTQLLIDRIEDPPTRLLGGLGATALLVLADCPHLCEDTAPADLAAGQRRQLRGLAESGLAYVPAPLLPEGRLPG
jgi:hypothetical protein